MNFEVKFSESNQSFEPSFQAIQEVSDGGYEAGYEAGYNVAYLDAELSEKSILERTAIVISNEKVTNLPDYAFYRYYALQTFEFPNLTVIGRNTFTQCTGLKRIEAPNLTSIGNDAFSYCSALEYADCGTITSIGSWVFTSCSMLKALILRRNSVVNLTTTNAFSGSAIANGTGFIYVPDNLVEQYKTAANWSTYSAQIKPISELEG